MKLTRRHGLLAAGILAAVLLVLLIGHHGGKLWSLLRLTLLGVIFAYLLTPVCDWLERFMKRSAAIPLLILTLLSLTAAFFLVFLPGFLKEIMVLADRIPHLVADVRDKMIDLRSGLSRLGLPQGIQTSLSRFGSNLERKALDFFTVLLDGGFEALGSIPDLFLVPVLGFYMLKDREYFTKTLKRMIPASRKGGILKATREIHFILHRFIRGQVFVSIIIAALSTVGYLAVGLPYAMILGLFAGAMEIVPYFGPWLGAVPAVLTSLLLGPSQTLWTIGVILIIQQLENGIITPKVLGGEVRLHPVYVILALWAGGMFYGILGMFFAVPVLLILRVLFKHLFLSVVACP